MPVGTTETTVASFTIPAGTPTGAYQIVATLDLVETASGNSEVQCAIFGPEGEGGQVIEGNTFNTAGFVESNALAVTDVQTLAAGDQVIVRCRRAFGPANVAAQFYKMTLQRSPGA